MKSLNFLVLVSFLVAAAAECPFTHEGGNAPPTDDGAPSPPYSIETPPAPPTSTESPAYAPSIALPPADSPAFSPSDSPAPAPAPSQKNKTKGLSPDYYKDICPNLESLVEGAVKGMMATSPIAAAATLRLFFHDCFVTGCDASIMIVNPNNDDERHTGENQFLRVDGYNTILAAKAAVDADPQCANKVSCADIMALAARDSVYLSGMLVPSSISATSFFLDIKMELGRYDSLGARASDVSLPGATEDVPALMKRFSAQGFSVTDLVALSGGHTLGACSCFFINPRIYPNDGLLDPGFASQLQGTCPSSMDPNKFAFFDQTVTTFDNNYFLMLQQKKGILYSDSVLYFDSSSKDIVDKFAANQNAFFKAFVDSMLTLGRLGLKTAADGEIRKNCLFPN